ncbi:PREDICTED: phosphorylated adapter RNA export protein [Camelina sativa]|uniref:Phosphorylated adapter RNA export protein n=1 Tax=Camelina sativa TaxID=90675 RepID=A0ABM0W651_CAMSA|nr:PREDICTED: phosphorylated adapter RNA export protein [Camelina sativa]
MEGEESLLDAINEEDGFENVEDVDMVDVEEGEILVEHDLDSGERPNGDGGGDGDKYKGGLLGKKDGQDQPNKNKKKKKKKKKRIGPAIDKPMSVDWFVRDTCRRLKEKKSYMIYTAVGCLGMAALGDLVNEVEAIETCGGQVTVDGSRKRTGGGVLWNIIKARQPAAYREIMKKTKEFEKQFRYPNTRPKRDQGSSSEGLASADEALVNEMCDTPVAEQTESKPQVERKPVHERIRVPVSYDDLFSPSDA